MKSTSVDPRASATVRRSLLRSRRPPPSSRTIPTETLAPLAAPVGIEGKFFASRGEKHYVEGVTYGAFRPDADGNEYHDLERIDRDFAQMAENGINAVRIPHTTPPRSLLDIAQRHGLDVMVGLSAEQLLGYVIDRRRDVDPEEAVRERVRRIAGHPALLCYALGNEIPAHLVRWYGSRRVERYLERLCRAVKDEDRNAIVTYVNYPSTEYLDLAFLDLLCYNVYLERREPLEAYLARLQNIAGDRPLILSEIGLDSLRNGTAEQARSLEWQIGSAFSSGCAGVFVFAWTDEWHRAGEEVHDWAFGITDRERTPKPALATVRAAFGRAPLAQREWPRFSVVVCSYDGARTIRACLEGLGRLEYPDYEVIVVDDGSRDGTARIAAEFPDVRLIRTENRGLSSARNTGLAAATGSLVAYIDDDAWPDPHWLQYLAAGFEESDHAGIGGPNVAPPGDGWIAECVANAPGGPTHVLLSDRIAEHIPGCNMAFRKACLDDIGGFDPQFRVAGDDVDLCWRLQERGWTLGFSPAAMVWHRRRNSVRTYLAQQRGYGRAERSLERKWPQKYNESGRVTWSGRIYGSSLTRTLGAMRGRVYHGIWGQAPFQRLYHAPGSVLDSVPLTPVWYVATAALAMIAALGLLWRPLLLVLPALLAAVSATALQAWLSTGGASFVGAPSTPGRRLRRALQRLLTASLHVAQPLVRLWGRLQVDPWRGGADLRAVVPLPRSSARWVERGGAPHERLHGIESSLREHGAPVRRGGEWDRWDLEVRGGGLGAVRLIVAIEDHGSGNQLVRFRRWPRIAPAAATAIVVLSLLASGAALDGAAGAAVALAAAALTVLLHAGRQCGLAAAAQERVLGTVGDPSTSSDMLRDGSERAPLATALEAAAPAGGR